MPVDIQLETLRGLDLVQEGSERGSLGRVALPGALVGLVARVGGGAA